MTSIAKLRDRTEIRVSVHGYTLAIAATGRGANRAIRPYTIHRIDAKGCRHPFDLGAYLTSEEEWWVRCMASGLRSAVEFAVCPPFGDEPDPDGGTGGDDQGEAGELDPQRPATTDPATCGHPRITGGGSMGLELMERCLSCGAEDIAGAL